MKKTSSSKNKSYLYLGLGFVAIFAVIFWFYKPTPVPVTIDLVRSITFGPNKMTTVLYKQTPVGIKGPYLISDPNGNVAEVSTSSDLDYLVGREVVVEGKLLPPKKLGGNNTFVLESIKESL
ncbi:hypothetical protein KBD75_02935 [Candidatus Woesebacteria bacterium]|nr:hypothetical protein [Candidatus Woesebacteria bacterium]